MRLLVGLSLMLLGAAIMLVGIVLALRELGGLYQGVLDDPLGQSADAEDEAQRGMFRGVAIGAVGILPFLVGVFLFRGEVARRLRRARSNGSRDMPARGARQSRMIDPSRYRVLTFDCYGTLIDWESGILAALHALLGRHGLQPPTDEVLLQIYAELEPAAQAGEYRPYRDVLADVTRGFAEALGIELDPGEERTLADSITGWPAFKDTPEALARLAEHYDLAILSNIDRDLFEHSRPRLTARREFGFAAVITAEDTRSYKPAIGHFWHAIETLGVPGAQILHVAQSLYHDLVPAQSMGISTVWVNRRAGRAGGGATPLAEVTEDAEPDLVVPDLRTLADLLAGV